MDTKPEPLRLQNPADLLSAIPYLIGYHPTHTVLCVAVRDRHAPMLVNTPLASIAPDGGSTATAAVAAQVAAHVIDAADTAFIIGYGTPEQVEPVVAQFHAALHAVGVDVPLMLRATGRRYFCLTPDCDACPADGTGYDPDTSPVVVQSIVEGLTALPDRAAVAALLDPVAGPRRAQLDAACRRASRRLQTMLRNPAGWTGDGTTWTAVPRMQAAPAHVAEAGVAALRGALDAARRGRVLSDDEVGWLAVVLRIGAVEAAAWRLNTEDAWQRQLWTDVVRRATPALTSVPACLLASTAYHAGNGTLANIAVRRALQIDPGNGFAQLLEFALDHGLPPVAWRAALQAATAD